MKNYLINISELRNGFLTEKDLNLKLDLCMVQLSGQSLDLSNLTINGLLFGTNEGIIVRAKAIGRVNLECSRCLDEYGHNLDIEIDDFYFYEKEEDEHFVENDSIDISLSIAQAIASSVDFKTLCKTDCSGICSKCGKNLNKSECKCSAEDIDIRWNKLQELKNTIDKNK